MDIRRKFPEGGSTSVSRADKCRPKFTKFHILRRF